MGRKSPSYKGLQPASAAASRVKERNRAVDTKPEKLLRSALWRLGLRYRKDVRALPGRPDVVFPGAHVALFCDGDFWHGRDWPAMAEKLARGTNPEYWIAKIRSNVERDVKNTRALQSAGWCVVRVWETDVTRDAQGVAARVARVVRSRQNHAGSTNREGQRGDL